jgi:hypothetical protein
MRHRLAAVITGLARRRCAALASLGGLTPTKEAVRDVRTTWLDGLWRDVRRRSSAVQT